MDLIFHEKQEGGLCAQHCLNSLLQGPYYTAVDLATFAKELDQEEQQHMAEGGIDSSDYLNFMQQPSANMDDTGFFSIQVIQRALEVWSLEMIPFNSPSASVSRMNPMMENAYICNLQSHWFTIRKLGKQWFNLNSLLKEPELISNTYLSLLLAQLRNDGYSIYMVRGQLPACEADQYLVRYPVSEDEIRTYRLTQRTISGTEANEDAQQRETGVATSSDCAIDSEDVRRRRLEYFEGKERMQVEKPLSPSNTQEGGKVHVRKSYEDMTDEEKLEAALRLSMENDSG